MMFTKKLVCTAIFYIVICFAKSEYLNVTVDDEFDLLIFTQHWPITVCDDWKEHNASHECCLPQNHTWTIHGIWPTKFGTIGPQFCNNSWNFEPNDVKPIEPQLEQLWINIEKDTPIYSLWSHEWSKHGTCAAILPQLSTQYKYFLQGLNWIKKYTMSEILASSNIKPLRDGGYLLVEIYKAVKYYLGKNPVIECRKEKGENFLFEIRICFDKNLKLCDCDGVVANNMHLFVNDEKVLSNCDPTNRISYPISAKGKSNYNFIQMFHVVEWLQWFTM